MKKKNKTRWNEEFNHRKVIMEEFTIKMAKDEMLRFYTNKIVEDGIMSCTNFDTVVCLEDYGDGIDLSKYKDEILNLLYRDERIADVTIDDELFIDMVFYTDYCPYYYDEEQKLDEDKTLNKLAESRYLEDFSYYYSGRYLFENPYITTRSLINNFVNEIENIDRKQRYKIANMLKMNIVESGFVDKYIKNTEVFVTPKNYKEFENTILKIAKDLESNKESENEEEFE
jgi:hypothetical protein